MGRKALPRTMEGARGAKMLARMLEQPTTAWGILLQAVGGTTALARYLGRSGSIDAGRWSSLGIPPRHAAMMTQCVNDCGLQSRLEVRLEGDDWFLRLREVPDGR